MKFLKTIMSIENQCRLCFSCDQGEHMNIFRENDLGMKISDIISDHFKCEVFFVFLVAFTKP